MEKYASQKSKEQRSAAFMARFASFTATYSRVCCFYGKHVKREIKHHTHIQYTHSMLGFVSW